MCVCIHRAAESKHREVQLKTLPGRFLCNPSVAYSRLGTHFYPPLHSHASSLKQGAMSPPPKTGSWLCPLLCIYIFPLGDRQMGQWTEPQTDS